jgi:hypothetical protein
MNMFASIDQVSASEIEQLKERCISEGPVLDYKEKLLPLNDDSKYELLKDVSAMANSDGGTIIYGVKEQDGFPIGYPGLKISSVDDLSNRIDQILLDGLEERIPNIKHRAISKSDGLYYYIISIPSSYLSPHMITGQTTKPRFYQRVNTINAPMNIRQIKETVLKLQTAEDKAIQYVKKRNEYIESMSNGSLYYVLHIVPLYGRKGAVDLTDYNVIKSLDSLGTGSHRMHTIDGYKISFLGKDGMTYHTLIARNGAIEIYCPHDLQPYCGKEKTIFCTQLERRIINNAAQISITSVQGVVELPVLIALFLSGTQNTNLWDTHSDEFWGSTNENKIVCDETVLYDWAQLDSTLKSFFDFICQAYGKPKSPNYNYDGSRKEG